MDFTSGGVPRPVNENQKKASAFGAGANTGAYGAAGSVKKVGYQSSAMDAREHKLELERQRQVTLLKRQLETMGMELRTAQRNFDESVKGIRQLGVTQASSAGSASATNTSELESKKRSVTSKISGNEAEINTLKQKAIEADASARLVVDQKKTEEKTIAQQIIKIKEEIRQKTLDLQNAQTEDVRELKEIKDLESKINSGANSNRQNAEMKRLNDEIRTLTAQLGEHNQKIQQVQKTADDKDIENKNLENKRKKLEQDKERFRVQVEGLEKAIGDLNQKITALNIK